MEAVCDLVTDGFVVENTDDGRTAGFGFMNQADNRRAVFGIQRGGGFVEQ